MWGSGPSDKGHEKGLLNAFFIPWFSLARLVFWPSRSLTLLAVSGREVVPTVEQGSQASLKSLGYHAQVHGTRSSRMTRRRIQIIIGQSASPQSLRTLLEQIVCKHVKDNKVNGRS